MEPFYPHDWFMKKWKANKREKGNASNKVFSEYALLLGEIYGSTTILRTIAYSYTSL